MNIKEGVLHEGPDDLRNLLMADSTLLEKWNSLTPIQRNEWICWITIVKKAETRTEHLQCFTEELKDGQRKPCCWPGCPHRRESAKKWFKEIS